MSPLRSIPGYQLKGLLASAELTETYRARRSTPQGKQSVALKVLRLDRIPQEMHERARQRFVAAGRSALSATVRGTARVVAVGDDSEHPFVATELVPGIDLGGLLRLWRKRNGDAVGLPPSVVAAVGAGISAALAVAHEASPVLCHFGLSPGNVRVTPEADIVLLDFGLDASLRPLAREPRPGWSLLAPELLRAHISTEFGDSGQSADLYSLGALMFLLLSGQPPVEAGPLAQMAMRKPAPLSAVGAAPDELSRAIQALTDPDPAQRPSSAREVEATLSAILPAQEKRQLLLGALRSVGIRSRAKTPSMRKTALVGSADGGWSRWRWYLVGAGCLVIAVAAVLGLWPTQGPGQPDGLASKRPNPRARPLPQAMVGEAALGAAEIPSLPRRLDGGLPTDRVYMPMPKRKLPRVPEHLDIDTTPTGADIWVDGTLRGKTPTDLVLGTGGHRVVLLKEGFAMHKAVYDTTEGEWIRVSLASLSPPVRQDGYLDVKCRGRFPIFIDGDETGILCPASKLPVQSGARKVGVFVPLRRAMVETEVTVPASPRPTPVVFDP